MFIRKAERKKAKLRLGISGPSGSGKTRSALEIATGMNGKIGMIDTESGRGELYANNFNYDIIRLEAPYSPERYIEAMKTFEKAGYDILIVDSLSHAWSGAGGVLSIVDAAGGQFQNGWKVGTPKQNALIEALITSKMHIITTFRVKTEYVVELNEKGKNVPRKVGLAPIQRDQIEYEFTLFMSMNQEHIAHVTKDNTNLYDQQFIKPTQEMGVKLMEWLNIGVSDKEVFINERIPEMLLYIQEADSMDDLRERYLELYKQHNANYPEAFEAITKAKDLRKDQLFLDQQDNGILAAHNCLNGVIQPIHGVA